ncbi:hypothetical protein B0T19DRAFT_471055 [Cercophora scortea]|uniref:Zincin n=1 Tax=Cercophora scortea TaxID=314031 RepID=A0AAE0J2R7_9PEZI|nr:hypothetical protein B0T19DRAFT_471055 [Cercophora scortea]
MRTILEKDYQGVSNYTAVQARCHLANRQVSVDEENFRLIKTSYDACMDVKSIKEADVTPIVSLLDDLHAIWPFTGGNLTSPPTSDEDWASFSEAVLFLEKLDIHTNQTIITVEPAVYSLPSYDNKDTVGDYTVAIAQALLGVGLPGNFTEEEATSLASGIADLEASLNLERLTLLQMLQTEQAPAVEDGLPVNYQPDGSVLISPEVIAKYAPVLGIDAVVKGLVPSDYQLQNISLRLSTPGLYANIPEIVSGTPKSVLQSWIAWRTISVLAPIVESDSLAAWKKLGNVKVNTSKERWRTCIKDVVDPQWKYITGHFYLDANFNDKTRNLADEMATQIRSEFIDRIKTLPWMSDEVKALATQKVKNMKQFIAYPSSPALDIKSPESLATFYAGRNASADYFATTISFNRWNVARKWGQLTKPINPDELDDGSTVISVGANFLQAGNNIHVMTGIMELPSFSYDLPSYANFGGMGAVLGHEMVHGFDNTGRNFNQDGALSVWWDNSTISEFENRTQCFVNQYSSYRIEGPQGIANISGAVTPGENIADAGGLRAAYDTWKKLRADGKSNDWTIPGLEDFTPEQLFFIFYGNLWCSSETPAQVDLANPHSPGPIRIIGGVDNSAAFREAFSCPSKKPTCELW